MSLTLRVVYFCVFLSSFSSLTADARTIENEIEMSDGCEKDGRTYKVGEKWSVLGECLTYTCHKNGAYGVLACPAISYPPGSSCKETEMDLTKLYPHCCPNVYCRPLPSDDY